MNKILRYSLLVVLTLVSSMSFGQTTSVDNIAAFKALSPKTTATLTLKDAKVQYAKGNDIFVVDATGGINFYKSGLNYAAGQILNGTITATYESYNNLPELINVKEDKLVVTDGTITPIVMTVEEAIKTENACKLVTIKKVKAIKVEGKKGSNYFTDTTKKLQIYDRFKLEYTIDAENEMDYTGILIPFYQKMEIAPTVSPVTTGISNIEAAANDKNAPIYNLAGQRVGKDYKGVVIKNGQKYIQR